MDIFQALVLGVVEGVTEFLPVSSTGHMMMASQVMAMASTDFLKSFEIIIQLGAILAVVVLYAPMMWKNFEVLKRVIAAFIPTAVVGFVLYKLIKQFLLGNNEVVTIALAVGGVLIIIFEYWHREKPSSIGEIEKMSYSTALGIGLFQSLAVVPGVSRAAATILGGMLLGLRRSAITEFSFLLAIPTMAAATGYDILKNYQSFSLGDAHLLGIGFVTAFLVALVAVRFLLRFIKTHTFIIFGIYRILVAGVFWLFFIH